jgi:hypothetical protein
MIKVNYNGRLGNNMIQYAAAHILATRTNGRLITEPKKIYSNNGKYKTSWSKERYVPIDFGEVFDIVQPTGDIYNDTIHVSEQELYNHIDNPVTSMNYVLDGYFQDHRLLCKYRQDILKIYAPVTCSNKDDLFIACRLGDTLRTYMTLCDLDYIDRYLKDHRKEYKKAYVTSDTLSHPPLRSIIDRYDLTIYNTDPVSTIIYASQFNNMLLSAGTFSYWMAYLSEAENITVYNQPNDPLNLGSAWNYNPSIKFKK